MNLDNYKQTSQYLTSFFKSAFERDIIFKQETFIFRLPDGLLPNEVVRCDAHSLKEFNVH